MRKAMGEDILPSGNSYLLQQKLLVSVVKIEFRVKDSISFSQTEEFITGKQIHEWSEGHMCMDGVSGNEK